jgi:hypothetical protein
MDREQANRIIAEVFNEISDGIKSGSFGKKVKIGLTILGSEHGLDEIIKAAEIAEKKYNDFEVVLIGPKNSSSLQTLEVSTVEEGHKVMVELLESGKLDGCVTQHFDFPIGISTVGRIVAPGKGKDMLIATTTGTSSTNRVESMVLNTISGIAAAKALGIENPTVGILNVDGARKVERILCELKDKGYDIEFSNSLRSDGGILMRGNDLLAGTPDVMVCDSLTGNLLIKIFSSYTTGGEYEIIGAGYGPGIGENYDKLINIVSRASGAPLISEALKYCSECAKNRVLQIAESEFKKAKAADLENIISNNTKDKQEEGKDVIKVPPKKVVTFAISGIDILELDNACKALWKEGIYSESGMGCTGPIVLVAEEDSKNAVNVLRKAHFKS